LIRDAVALLSRSIQFDRDGEPAAAFADLEKRVASHLNGAKNGAGELLASAETPSPDNPVNDAKPTVRVSLDRLDALAKTLQDIVAGRTSIEPRMADAEDHEDLFARLQQQFRSLRLVAFNMLAPRFIRAVRMTCEEEGKQAELIIENGESEIDTRLLDSLVEPLLHLLRNAVVHGIEPPETRRLLGKREVGRVTLRIAADGPDTLIRVSDDGAGVDLAALKRKAVDNELISERSAIECDDAAALQLMFLRGLTTSTKLNINAGRGVGMSIVKESVESQSGTIEVETTRQRGTTFVIRIKDPFLASPSSSSSSGSGVLVVDDSPTIRRLTSRMLANSGFTVATAEDGVDALDRLNAHKQLPDLIISDVEMPRMNGFELLAAVRHDERFCRIPVVIITSLSDATYRRKAAERGARAFLRKPINEPELLRVINECMGRAAEAAR
jgi:CheY-like chemotaxis protein/two-component sensor histidine kinase